MSKPKIIVVDDEPSILNLITAYLRPEGYAVYTAADGPSGMHAALVYQPDLVVLDIMLPGMDGVEVLARLRRESDVYVILLTAKTNFQCYRNQPALRICLSKRSAAFCSCGSPSCPAYEAVRQYLPQGGWVGGPKMDAKGAN